MTTSDERARELRAEIDKLAPCENDPAKVTARQLARQLAAQAQIGWERLWVWPSEPEPSRDYLMSISVMTAQFAAAHALRALADAAPAVADEAAKQIVDAWNDGGGVGEWIWEHHGAHGRQIAELAKELAPLTLPAPKPERARIVCLCGSTRFYDQFQQANYDLTMKGEIVLSVGFYPHAKAEHGHGEGVGHDSAEKIALDELHKRKIDLADYVLVLNVGQYIGESTRSEIEYARSAGKDIVFLEPIPLENVGASLGVRP